MTRRNPEVERLEALVSALRTDLAKRREDPGDMPVRGCGDHSCIVAQTPGMGTNGCCRCDEWTLRRAVQWWRRRDAFLVETIRELKAAPEGALSDAIRAPLTFTVPGPPVPKGRPRVAKGHAFTPARTRAYEKHVGLFALAARQAWRHPWPLGALFTVEIDVYRTALRGDADNFAKAILDGCNGVLWTDDSQVHDLHVRVHHADVPRVEVRARPGATS